MLYWDFIFRSLENGGATTTNQWGVVGEGVCLELGGESRRNSNRSRGEESWFGYNEISSCIAYANGAEVKDLHWREWQAFWESGIWWWRWLNNGPKVEVWAEPGRWSPGKDGLHFEALDNSHK